MAPDKRLVIFGKNFPAMDVQTSEAGSPHATATAAASSRLGPSRLFVLFLVESLPGRLPTFGFVPGKAGATISSPPAEYRLATARPSEPFPLWLYGVSSRTPQFDLLAHRAQ